MNILIPFLFLLCPAQEKKDQVLLIRAGKIHTVSNGTIDGGVLLIQNGRILKIGRKLPVPKGARVLDLGRKSSVTPGWIDLHSHLGSAFENNEVTESLTPHVYAVDAFEAAHPDVRRALSSGVTLIALSPGSRNLVGGHVSLMRLAGTRLDRMIYRRSAGLKISLTQEALLRDRTPTSTFGAQQLLRRELRNPESEVAKTLLQKGGRAFVHAVSVSEILRAITLKQEFGLRAIVLHADKGGLVLQELKNAGVWVGVGPLTVSDTREKLLLPGKLAEAGIRFAFVSDAPRTRESYVRVTAAFAVKYGLDSEAALRALTLGPARFLGIDKEVGSLQVGKLADLVVFGGDPLSLGSSVDLVIVGGRIVYQRKR